ILASAITLAERGYAAHWLRPRSKAPVAPGWQIAPVANAMALRQSYRPGYNVGVRCGHWSQPMPGHGLAVLDVDIHCEDASTTAMNALAALCGDTTQGPTVLSGSGEGGRHHWFACPLDRLPEKAAITLARANERMPDTQQWVWQIELLSTGKNLVVPPS